MSIVTSNHTRVSSLYRQGVWEHKYVLSCIAPSSQRLARQRACTMHHAQASTRNQDLYRIYFGPFIFNDTKKNKNIYTMTLSRHITTYTRTQPDSRQRQSIHAYTTTRAWEHLNYRRAVSNIMFIGETERDLLGAEACRCARDFYFFNSARAARARLSCVYRYYIIIFL